jgi:hypothetical protein
MGLVSVSASKSKKEVMCYIQIEEKPLTEEITCYDSIVVKSNSGIINIKGVVSDKSGEPIADVSVIIKNSIKGTRTDIDGKFTINASSKDSLVFSLIGFLPQTICVSELKANNTIIMEENENELSCYIVVVAEPPKAKPIKLKPIKVESKR